MQGKHGHFFGNGKQEKTDVAQIAEKLPEPDGLRRFGEDVKQNLETKAMKSNPEQTNEPAAMNQETESNTTARSKNQSAASASGRRRSLRWPHYLRDLDKNLRDGIKQLRKNTVPVRRRLHENLLASL